MKFKITIHARSGAPPDALDLLFPKLGTGRDHDVRFAKPGPAILATLKADSPISMERDERAEVGRQVVWNIVQDACEGVPGLRAAWFAVSPQR